MALVLWFVLAPLWFLLDGWLAAQLPVRCDLAAALCLTLGFATRASAVPALLACGALGRAALEDGDLSLHFLALGIPVAVLLPARSLFDERSFVVRAVACGALALAVPRLTVAFAELSGQSAAPVSPGLGGVLATMVLGPLAARGLGRLPPLRTFRADRPLRPGVAP
ncbi:MAG: hypothetical protein IPM29_20255 [Planctomycetes bacterium]|nr:hypothetical protein [Planctomycetota bacterium]